MLGENLENVRLIYLIFEYLQDYRVYFVPYNVPQKCQRLQERMAIYTQDSSWFVWEKKKKRKKEIIKVEIIKIELNAASANIVNEIYHK